MQYSWIVDFSGEPSNLTQNRCTKKQTMKRDVDDVRGRNYRSFKGRSGIPTTHLISLSVILKKGRPNMTNITFNLRGSEYKGDGGGGKGEHLELTVR